MLRSSRERNADIFKKYSFARSLASVRRPVIRLTIFPDTWEDSSFSRLPHPKWVKTLSSFGFLSHSINWTWYGNVSKLWLSIKNTFCGYYISFTPSRPAHQQTTMSKILGSYHLLPCPFSLYLFGRRHFKLFVPRCLCSFFALLWAPVRKSLKASDALHVVSTSHKQKWQWPLPHPVFKTFSYDIEERRILNTVEQMRFLWMIFCSNVVWRPQRKTNYASSNSCHWENCWKNSIKSGDCIFELRLSDSWESFVLSSYPWTDILEYGTQQILGSLKYDLVSSCFL